MEYATLTATMPNGQVLEHVIDLPSVTIGRGQGCNIVIDDVSVELRHARLVFDTGQAFLTDLGSSRGTLVDNLPLAEGARRLITAESLLRFGDVPCRMTVKGVPAVVPPVQPPESSRSAAIHVSSSPAVVEAGSTVRILVEIRNIGSRVDQFAVRALDLPGSWVHLSRDTISLMPSGKDTVIVDVTPPRTPESSAGEHIFWVEVEAQAQGGTVRGRGSFAISTFDDVRFRLFPRSPTQFAFEAQNRGNRPVALSLKATSPDRDVRFEVAPAAIEVQPGGEVQASVDVDAGPQSAGVPGAAVPFSVTASDADGNAVGGAEGEYVRQAPAAPPPPAMSPLSITAPAGVVALGANGRGSVEFSVTNTGRSALRARAVMAGLDGFDPGWLTVAGGAERGFPAAGTQRYVVRIQLPPGTPPAERRFRLDMVDAANPSAVFAQGPAVTCSGMASAGGSKLTRGYGAAIVGALVGMLAGASAGIILGIALGLTIAQLGGDLDSLGTGLAVVIIASLFGPLLGSSLGVWYNLRNRRHGGALMTGFGQAVIFPALVAASIWMLSTTGGGTEVVLVLGVAVPACIVLPPLVARAVALSFGAGQTEV